MLIFLYKTCQSNIYKVFYKVIFIKCLISYHIRIKRYYNDTFVAIFINKNKESFIFLLIRSFRSWFYIVDFWQTQRNLNLINLNRWFQDLDCFTIWLKKSYITIAYAYCDYKKNNYGFFKTELCQRIYRNESCMNNHLWLY